MRFLSGPHTTQSVFRQRLGSLVIIIFEIGFATWLLSGMMQLAARNIGILVFACMSYYNLNKALEGEVSCGCFGMVPLNPWFTLVLDSVAVITALVQLATRQCQ